MERKTVIRSVDENGRVRLPPDLLKIWNLKHGGDIVFDYDETGALILPRDMEENAKKTAPGAAAPKGGTDKKPCSHCNTPAANVNRGG